MTLVTIGTKKKFGIEDLEIGEGTLQQLRNGAQTTITKVGAHSIPYNDSSSIKEEIDDKVNFTNIVNSLTSVSVFSPLSANQGKILNESKLNTSDIVDDLTSTDANKALSANQGKILNESKLDKSNVVDDLTSTDTTKALSANQGKILNDAVAATVGGGNWTTIYNFFVVTVGAHAFADDPQGNDYNFTDFNELLVEGKSTTDNCNIYIRIPTNLIFASGNTTPHIDYSYGLYDSASSVIFHFSGSKTAIRFTTIQASLYIQKIYAR